MSQNAVGADKAVPFTANCRLEQKCFDRFRDLGVIQAATNGGYYLDIPAYDEYQRDRCKRLTTILLIVAVMMVMGIATGFLVGNTPHAY